MSKAKATPTELIQSATTYAQTHDCPYAGDILASSEIHVLADTNTAQLGNVGVILSKIDTLYLDLNNFHFGGKCRPDKVDRRQTSESRLWDADVHHTRSLLSQMGLRASAQMAA